MSKLNSNSRDKLIDALARELDTRDKRFMFIKCMFPHVPRIIARVNLEGSPEESAWQIFAEFEKQCMLGSLMACMNNVFDSELDLVIDG